MVLRPMPVVVQPRFRVALSTRIQHDVGVTRCAGRGQATSAQRKSRVSRVMPGPLDRHRLDLAGQPFPGDVQPPLDRAQRRLELVAHLQQRLSVDVERHQRVAV